MNRCLRPLLALTAALLAAGCAQVREYRDPRVEFGIPVVPPQAVVPSPATAAPGAIFQTGAYRPLFEDHRARLPGDTLVINIVERISASQSSTSSVEKKGALDGGVTALPGINPNALRRAGVGATGANTFDGKGATESSNTFSGTITAVVTGVLPNGHLLITGEKQIGVNANVDVLRFSGQIDPRVILPGNVVASTAVANVRLEQKSRGQQGDAQLMGFLGRFFLSVFPI